MKEKVYEKIYENQRRLIGNSTVYESTENRRETSSDFSKRDYGPLTEIIRVLLTEHLAKSTLSWYVSVLVTLSFLH